MLQLAVAREEDFGTRQAFKRAALLAESLLLWPEGMTIRMDVRSEHETIFRNRSFRTEQREPGLDDELKFLVSRGFVRPLVATYAFSAGHSQGYISLPGEIDSDALVESLNRDDSITIDTDEIAHMVELTNFMSTAAAVDAMPRVAAGALRRKGVDAAAIYYGSPFLQSATSSSDMQQLITVSARYLPVPTDLTPWEAIFDFRDDPETRGLASRFTRWLRKLATSSPSAAEIEEEIAEGIFEYERHMKMHDLASHLSGIESLVVVPLEIAEHLLKLRWRDAARSLFFIKRRRAELLQAETCAPYREIAYLLRARRTFGTP